MFRGVSISTVDFLEMQEEEKFALLGELYCIHKINFTTSKEDFFDLFLDKEAVEIKAQIFKNDQRRVVGYYLVRVFQRLLGNGRKCFVLMPQTALEKGYRGWAMMRSFLFYNCIALRYRFRSSFGKVYGFGAILSPVAYLVIHRLYYGKIHPTPDADTPDQIKATMEELAASFGYTEKYNGRFCTVLVGKMALKETSEHASKWLEGPNKAARFYVTNNPEYYKGYGLLTFVDLHTFKVTACSLLCLLTLLKYRISQFFVRKPVARTG
ncbi:MAG: hypothetical protein JW797_05765 [Bradymonadales bacterium]|nr:hypothetical protein [Bradymonadales bacterium]